MSENFAQLFEESIKNLEMRPGEIVKGEVVRIDDKFVLVDAGLKSEAFISVDQFKKEDGTLTVAVGDTVDVALEAVEDSYGETRLSRERARRIEVWQRLELACEGQENVIGVITGKVKGGFTVDLEGIKAFLPGSLVDVRPLRDTTFLEGKDLDFRVIKIDAKRNNVVVSRRAVIEAESSAERDALLESLDEGVVVKGIVKNLTDYGAFIDLGGIDGLLHITDMSWKRIRHPSEMIAVGDEIDVKVLKFDKEKGRVSLGLKQLGDDPWDNLIGKFPEGKRVHGEVTNVADYGCFVQLDDGIEGLVHVSEMDWTNKNVNPHKIVSLGQEVDVIVLEVDEGRRRISLGLKQCTDNPWQTFAATHQKGAKVKGVIKSITDFGVFIGLDGNIDGLIHLSDLSWDQAGEEAVHSFNKGDAVDAVVLAVDVDRERISLGIKQLQDNPFGNYQEAHKKGDVVKGTVTEVDERIVTLDLGAGVVGQIRVNDLSPDRIDDARQHAKAGDELEAKVVAFDRKNQLVTLSVKAVEAELDNQTKQKYLNNTGDDVGKTTLGDILKEQLGGGDQAK